MGHSYGAVAALYAAAQSSDVAAVISDSAFISFGDMVKRATTLLSEDPERSFWERLGLRLARFQVTEWAVRPIYYLRTGVWLEGKRANALAAISRIGRRPILFIAGEKDEICPPQNARRMYDAAFSHEKRILVVPNAEHDSTYSTAPQLYESAVVDFLQEALQRAALSAQDRFRSGRKSVQFSSFRQTTVVRYRLCMMPVRFGHYVANARFMRCQAPQDKKGDAHREPKSKHFDG